VYEGDLNVRVKVLGLGLLAGLVALLAAGPVANAAILTTAPETELFSLTAPQVTYTVTGDGTPPPTVNTNTPQLISQQLTFNQFDGGLGDLIGVTFTFSTVYGATATVTVANNGEDDTLVDFFSDAEVLHSIFNASLINVQSSTQLLSATCTADFGLGCPQTTQSDNGVNFNSPPGGFSPVAPVSSFVGSGTYALTATLNSGLTPRIDPDNGTGFGDNSTYSGTLDATWNGSVSVVYTYETADASVPVPLSLYLLVAGLGAVALSRRYLR
jgi:hypothetical protein